MADVVREGNEIVLKLSTGERIMAMHATSGSRSRR